MPNRFIQKAQRLAVERYKKPRDMMAIGRTHVSFSGSLQKHPKDPDKVIIIPDPYSRDQTYFEFSRGDIQKRADRFLGQKKKICEMQVLRCVYASKINQLTPPHPAKNCLNVISAMIYVKN